MREAAMSDPRNADERPAQRVPASDGRRPGDEARPGSPQTGEVACPACHGAGRQGGAPCPECAGTGRITVIVGDA
jgi:hypothetical protein